jgi:cytochrome P450
VTSAPPAAVTFDAYDPGFVEDPYPTYSVLRRDSPVFRDDTWGLTFFTRHPDVSAILRDRRFGRDVRSAVSPEAIDPATFERIYPSRYPTWTRLVRGSFIDLEPPAHTRIRRLVQNAFGKRASESYRARLVETADRALDVALERGSMEVISDYATPIPLTMIADLLGVPAADQPRLVSWSHAIVRVFDEACTEAEGDAAEEAIKAFAEYVKGLLGDHRAHPRDDLTSALLEAEADGDRLTEEELVATCILTLNAGHEATVQAIGNAVLALAADPEAFESLRRNPGVVRTAAAEMLRYDTPLQMFERWVLEDLEWDGVELARGSKVGLLFGSANRDESVFERADRLVLDRAHNPHVSFGAGVHFCVGAPLALVELEVALERMASRVGSIEVAAHRLPRTPSLIFRGVDRLPADLTPAG